eukprot:2049351-Pyramimonas_sp.AAC.1
MMLCHIINQQQRQFDPGDCGGGSAGVFGKEELEKNSKNNAVILPDLTDFKLVEELFGGMPSGLRICGVGWDKVGSPSSQ